MGGDSHGLGAGFGPAVTRGHGQGEAFHPSFQAGRSPGGKWLDDQRPAGAVTGGAGDRGRAAPGGKFVAGQDHQIQDAGTRSHMVGLDFGGSRGGRGWGGGCGFGPGGFGPGGLRPGFCRARPQLAELGLDLGNGVGHRKRLHQILRHRRPSRWSNSSAAAGPHEPDA